MSQVISFADYTPAPRYDLIPWSEVRVEESTTADGPWVQIDALAISPFDADPAHPTSRSFTTTNATDTDGLWYRLIFADASGDTLEPTVPVQNIIGPGAYATAEELADLLHVNVDDRRSALERVLNTAAYEINQEIGRSIDNDLEGWELDLAAEVNLERAVEHWRQMQSPWGLVAMVGDTVPAFTQSETWQRHAHKLAPLRQSWGIA